MTSETAYILPERFTPGPEPTGLDQPYWDATRQSRLVIQHCPHCHHWQWGPEWACYTCGRLHPDWEEVPRTNDRYRGHIYSWERVWHPTDPRLSPALPYVVLIVTLPTAENIRMIGNLTGNPTQPVTIGANVAATFEHHPTFTLVQWELIGDGSE